VCVSVRSLKEKRLKLSISNLVDIQFIAVAQQWLTLRSNCQILRSCDYHKCCWCGSAGLVVCVCVCAVEWTRWTWKRSTQCVVTVAPCWALPSVQLESSATVAALTELSAAGMYQTFPSSRTMPMVNAQVFMYFISICRKHGGKSVPAT